MLLAGFGIARQRAALAMKRAVRSAGIYAAALLSALVAGGFLTAAAFMHLMARFGAANSCAIMAAAYAAVSIVGFVILRSRQKRGTGYEPALVGPVSSQVPASFLGNEMPVGIVSIGLLAAVSYLFGRSLRRRVVS